jgi:hypothetical protein
MGSEPAAESWLVAAEGVSRRYALPDGTLLAALDRVSLKIALMAPVLPLRVRFDRVERARGLIAAVGLAGRERSLPRVCRVASSSGSPLRVR